MLLHELMILHRNEIIAACEAELQASNWTGSFANDVLQHFDAIVTVLERYSGAASELPNDGDLSRHGVLGADPAIVRVRFGIDQLSRRSRTPVLFIGEFGTGKRHSARALHAATYPEGEFFELVSASNLDELERHITALRSCTSPESTGGLTIYVPELTEAPTAIQRRLSQLLPEQGLSFRVIASSSRDLANAARQGSLRQDLMFRFPTTLELPPLRDRKSDIPLFTQEFAALVAKREGTAPIVFEQSALDRMAEHGWPGNLTELCNFVEHMYQAFGPVSIGGEEIPELGGHQSGAVFHLPQTGIDFAQLERDLLVQALTIADGNQTRAASLLRLTRDQLRYRLAKFDISSPLTRVG